MGLLSLFDCGVVCVCLICEWVGDARFGEDGLGVGVYDCFLLIGRFGLAGLVCLRGLLVLSFWVCVMCCCVDWLFTVLSLIDVWFVTLRDVCLQVAG